MTKTESRARRDGMGKTQRQLAELPGVSLRAIHLTGQRAAHVAGQDGYLPSLQGVSRSGPARRAGGITALRQVWHDEDGVHIVKLL